ncbi:uncharacterized protein LOC119378613 [Rhipicephalus sanguineus]|uniref:uncharacterized protein LOC119378613 n=1 Tax=Rhipicephalus sanguineus TaxID=34632 RepID=UPI0020C2DFE1|nr:uncharacterized protein LOC119378613 [Rhipicephalus sanguineus]
MTQKPEDAKEDPPEAGRVRRQAATAATAAAAADDVPGPSTETPAAKRPRGRPPKAVSVEPIAPKPTAARKSRKTFDFDIRSIDWVAYMEQYILGVRRYVLKEDPSTIPTARRNLNSHNESGTQNKPTSWTALCSTASEPAQRIYYIGMLAQLLFVAGVIRLLVKHTRTFNDLWWSLVSNILQLAVRISLAVQSIASRH